MFSDEISAGLTSSMSGDIYPTSPSSEKSDEAGVYTRMDSTKGVEWERTDQEQEQYYGTVNSVDWLFNVTINDISFIHVTAHRHRLKKK